jgi:hypothetical protein
VRTGSHHGAGAIDAHAPDREDRKTGLARGDVLESPDTE